MNLQQKSFLFRKLSGILLAYSTGYFLEQYWVDADPHTLAWCISCALLSIIINME